MSVSRCLVFLGIRVLILPNDVEAVERRIDPRMKRAQANGLQCYWSDFGSQGERYYLFIGKQVGVFGIENRRDLNLSMGDFDKMAAETTNGLAQSGFANEPALYVQWEKDH